MDSLSVKRRLTCILATDAVGYSRLVNADETGALRVLAAHRAVIDGIIAYHDGRIANTAGDSVLAEFGSVVEGVRCAVEIQDALKTRNESLPESQRMHFRIGINLGEVVVKGDDLLGDGVNVAARLQSIAQPGGILVSSSVYDQITGKLDLGFQDMGEQALKNISRPIHVYRLTGSAPPVRPAQAAVSTDSSAPARTAAPARRPASWTIGALAAIGVVALVAALAWQAGWLRTGPSEIGGTTKAMAPKPAPGPENNVATAVDAAALRTQAEADAQRVGSEAEALRRQAETELARTRAEADAARAARTKADAEAAAARTRKEAEADAARIRADAQAKAAEPQHDADAKARVVATAPRATAPSQDNSARVAAVAHNATFDGVWNVTVSCPAAADGALGYKLEFVAQVKDGYLRGIHGTEGTPNSLRIEGQIQSDGSATLDAKGHTGDPKFTVKRMQKGTPYSYHVTARFDGSRGNGSRIEMRPCDLRFVEQ